MINNYNVWDYEWKNLNNRVEVIDPIYKEKKQFNEFQITIGEEKMNFVAGEFSNLIWGFYLKKNG